MSSLHTFSRTGLSYVAKIGTCLALAFGFFNVSFHGFSNTHSTLNALREIASPNIARADAPSGGGSGGCGGIVSNCAGESCSGGAGSGGGSSGCAGGGCAGGSCGGSCI